MTARFGANELIVALGAAIVLISDLLFVILGPYSFSSVIWAASAVALVVVLAHRSMPFGISANYQAVVLLAVMVAVLVAIRDLVVDLMYIPGRSLDVTFYLGMLGLYVGVAIMAFGAWRMWMRRS